MKLFTNRSDAGKHLAKELMHYAGRPDVVVLALPRGGVPVAYEVAKALHAPLDVFLVRKLGLPGQEELAMGAIASGGVRALNEELIRSLDIPEEILERVTQREERELQRREQLYRGSRPRPELKGKTTILIDDGLATGASMHAAVKGVRAFEPGRIVVAVPVADRGTCAGFKDEVDEIICIANPRPFWGVGAWYVDFSQVSDKEVQQLLETAAAGFTE